MVDLALNRAVQELSRYFRLYSLEELIDQSLKKNEAFVSTQASQNAQDAAGVKGSVLNRLLTILVETQRGSLTSPELIKEIESINEQFRVEEGIEDIYDTVVVPYFENVSFTDLPSISEIVAHPELDSSVNSTFQSPTKESPTISLYQIKTIRINPTNKSTNAVSLFMNTIPTFEWSRAMPYLNVEFQLARPNIANNKISSLSLLKFLEGAKPLSQLSGADLILAGATSNGIDPSASGSSGIELFTSPQTMVNVNSEQDVAFRVAPIIDVFRPFASLKSFNVEVVPAPGIMSYRTGKLNFIIHDRARLHEIADFIKPDQYSTAEILVEYGWSHPDNNSPFGAFINALRVKEKFMVKNNSFAFKPNGEVIVDLDLYTKGANELYTNSVSTDSTVVKVQEEIQRLQDRVKSFRLRVFKQEAKYTKEVRGAQILSSASDGNSELQLSRALKQELRKVISSLGGKGAGDDAKQLRQALVDLYGKDGTGGEAKILKTSIASAINRKIEKIKGERATPDPFIYVDTPVVNRTKNDLKEKNTHKNYVSLAKIFLLFLAEPLASTNRFDDIQLLFYTFNDHAGAVHDRNIGSFLLDIEVFRQRYQKVSAQRRTADLNLRDFVDFISNSFVDDISSVNYGMRELYDYEPDKESGSRVRVKRKFKEATILNRKIEELMKRSGIADGVFKAPILDVFVECVPAVKNEERLDQQEINAKTILRIHIFDKVASAYSTQGELLAAAKDDMITTIGDVPIVDQDTQATLENKQQAQDLITRAIDRGLIAPIVGDKGKDKVYEIKGGVVQLKEFVASTMPSIVFGTQNSSVIDGGLKSMTDDRLATINMIRAGDAGPLSPNGVGHGGVPLQLMPAQMDLRCRGCPIIEYAQNFFVDYQTNTSIDNIYVVTKIAHNIEGNGTFSTQLGMTPLDAYGQYRSLTQKIGESIRILGQFTEEEDDEPVILTDDE